MLLKVKECLFGEAVSVKRGTPLKDIIKVFKVNHFHNLPVVDEENKVVGRITLEDIIAVFHPQSSEITQLLKTIPFIDTVPESEIDIRNVTPEMGILIVADEIMTKNFFAIDPEDSIAKAYSLMKTNNTNILMIADKDNKFFGVISMFDIMYTMFTKIGVISES